MKLVVRKAQFIAAAATLLLLGWTIASSQGPQYPNGRFSGAPIVELGDGGRKVRLVEEFSYVDPREKIWRVPKDTIVDGASIPRAFWSVVGGPFEGTYRDASIIHDHYCTVRTEPWQDVHRMFYYGMLARGTLPGKAKAMYYAVRVGGPRWKQVLYTNHPPRAFPKPGDIDEYRIEPWQVAFNEATAKQTMVEIEAMGPSLEEIERLADIAFTGREPPNEVRLDLQKAN